MDTSLSAIIGLIKKYGDSSGGSSGGEKFIVDFTAVKNQDNTNTITCNKTAYEIIEACNSGKIIEGLINIGVSGEESVASISATFWKTVMDMQQLGKMYMFDFHAEFDDGFMDVIGAFGYEEGSSNASTIADWALVNRVPLTFAGGSSDPYNAANHGITNVAAPVNQKDVATKGYVDNALATKTEKFVIDLDYVNDNNDPLEAVITSNVEATDIIAAYKSGKKLEALVHLTTSIGADDVTADLTASCYSTYVDLSSLGGEEGLMIIVTWNQSARSGVLTSYMMGIIGKESSTYVQQWMLLGSCDTLEMSDTLDEIYKMNTPVTVSGATPTITGETNRRYVCGEVSTLSIAAPSSGSINVLFKSGATPTVLTATSRKANTIVKWTNGFDPSNLEANTQYEIEIAEGEWAKAFKWS